MSVFSRDQCEIADYEGGPWRDPVEGETARYWRVKPSEIRWAMMEGGFADPKAASCSAACSSR